MKSCSESKDILTVLLVEGRAPPPGWTGEAPVAPHVTHNAAGYQSE